MAWFWGQIEGNVLSAPVLALAGALAGFAFRRPIGRLWHRMVGDRLDLGDIRRDAQAARRIMADLFEHHTGTTHPDAPKEQQ